MTVAEILALVPAVIGALIGAWLIRLPDQQPHRSPTPHAPRALRAPTAPTAPAVRPSLSPALRAELEQTPQWWLDQYHQLLRATGAERVGGEEWEIATFSGPVYLHHEEGYADCPCPNCRRICS